MHECPQCRQSAMHRSRTRSAWETWRREFTGKRPFRCHGCGWRGWAVDLGPSFGDEETELAMRAMAPDPPNLKDTAFAPEKQRAHLNLDDLDIRYEKRN